MNSSVQRTISGVLFIGIMVGGLLVHPLLYALLTVLLMVGMLHEFFRMNLGNTLKWHRRLAIATAITFFIIVYSVLHFNAPFRYVAIPAFMLLTLLCGALTLKSGEEFSKITYVFTGLLYIAIPLSLSNFLVFDAQGSFNGLLMLSFFCIIWSSDVGAYCFGLLFGKNGPKLSPTISEHKSWAGFWGGLAMALFAGTILYLCGWLRFQLVHCLGMAAVMHVAGVFGDLFESKWKRVAGIKDSGNIIPGHGGLLDRFDSALFAIPAAVMYLVVFGISLI